MVAVSEANGRDIAEMVSFPVIDEACRVLDDGIAVKASDLDFASIFGMGFPPYRGGIKALGGFHRRRIHAKLPDWEVKYGQHFRPCPTCQERAAAAAARCSSERAPTSQAKARL